jgi:ankyrin repeat protein
MEAGAPINLQDGEQSSALMLAVQVGHYEVVECLIGGGVVIDLVNCDS